MSVSASEYVTEDMKKAYREDGVVCLRGLVSQPWIARLREAAERVIEKPLEHGGKGYLHGPMTAVNYLFLKPSAFRDFLFETNVGEVMARIIGSRTAGMYHDYVFAKQPGCEQILPWHTDSDAYAMKGEMMPGLWIALTDAHETNGRVEYIAGLHREIEDGKWAEQQKSGKMAHDWLPNFESPDDPVAARYRRVSWNLKPGDAVLFHPNTPHHSKGNRTDSYRIGYAVRIVGDDVVWETSKTRWLQIPGVDYESVRNGDPVIQNEAFRLMWKDTAA